MNLSIFFITSFSHDSPTSTTSVQSVTLKAFLTFKIKMEMEMLRM